MTWNVLTDDGKIIMEIPVLNKTFDQFKWPSTIDDLLYAYATDRKNNLPFQIFKYSYLHTQHQNDKTQNLYEDALNRMNNPYGYTDIHTFYYTPNSFLLIIRELNDMGLFKLGMEKITQHGNSMTVVLGKGMKYSKMNFKMRSEYMKKIRKEL